MAETILIVDDDLDTLRLVGLLLEKQGYQILAADNGKQAIDKAAKEQPDIVLLDVMMPDLDGFEVAKILRTNEQTAGIPIVFFTAKTQVEDKIAGFEVGADDYLTKPVHPAELTARVKAILTRSEKTTVSVHQPESEKGKVIGFLAARGGVGTTTIVLNTGIAMQADLDDPVIVAELRPGQGTLALELGLANPDRLTSLLSKSPDEITQHRVKDSLVDHSSGLHLLLASYQPADSELITEASQFKNIVKQLSHLGKFTLLDLGPSLSPGTSAVLDLCDQVVVLVEPEPNMVTHTKALLDDLSMRILGLDRIRVGIVSRIRSDLKLTRTQIQDQLGYPTPFLFTPVPELAYQAARAKVPLLLVKTNQSDTQLLNNRQQFQALAQAIVGQGQKVRL